LSEISAYHIEDIKTELWNRESPDASPSNAIDNPQSGQIRDTARNQCCSLCSVPEVPRYPIRSPPLFQVFLQDSQTSSSRRST
jgi:hypothetical protein